MRLRLIKITHTSIDFKSVRELIPQRAGFGFSLVRFFSSIGKEPLAHEAPVGDE